MTFNTTPSLIIFDWDGTLVSTLGLLHDAHNHARKELGYTAWTLEEYKKHMHNSSLKLYPELYGERAEEGLGHLYKYVEENHLTGLAPLDNALEFIEMLSSKKIPMVLVSNKKHRYLIKEVAALGWKKYFLSIVGAGEAANDKPDPDPVYMALEQAKIAKESLKNALYFGDTTTDVECAKSLGVECVLTAGALNCGEVAAFDNLSSLLEVFDK
ncbi:MAG: HAD family hydrolase [Alphaproteobacteria bacterium]|nr:HAD family hydrolase [Alphaproteobacteria bacterium]|tara:strand:+ start:2798 stop:3436 length:639 start_codon:yes stop_codon:yes gene_type:complete